MTSSLASLSSVLSQPVRLSRQRQSKVGKRGDIGDVVNLVLVRLGDVCVAGLVEDVHVRAHLAHDRIAGVDHLITFASSECPRGGAHQRACAKRLDHRMCCLNYFCDFNKSRVARLIFLMRGAMRCRSRLFILSMKSSPLR